MGRLLAVAGYELWLMPDFDHRTPSLSKMGGLNFLSVT